MKRNDSRAIARIKRMYQMFKDCWFIRNDKEWRPCESITEFLELRWVKRLKNTGSFKKYPLEKLDAKQKNRRERYSKKKQIREGIEEYNTRYDESCGNCEFFDTDSCSLHKTADDKICENFRD